jgi:molybdate transport system regulatory protein
MWGDDIALGTGKAELLAAISETGSIAAAGRKMGMSYRRAWLLVETMNQCFYEPLVISTKGGKHGGGAQLSALGEQVLALFGQMLAQIQQHTQTQQQELLALLKD